jgi:SNF2 family DNA or RNA helicase
MTGTPMENHLGELWSLMHFLSPGYLGSEKQFRRIYRDPIEKAGDKDRRSALAKRIRPFLMRRRKEDVAKELPEKTEIVRTVEIDGLQRDLYETIRLAMHEKVRQEVEKKGMARSQIVILDALLKLRQVCCDPRLVKLERARAVKQSAKLELLREMLPELIGEGRRVLLFSQFTSMLDLIEADVNALKIPFVRLTGQTNDRETPVRRFQAQEFPLFLISLKAGGTGLNLTAADTVIHYDPWWNPAVERQATDRAHRIGQDKKVFVYKLVTSGTVEEKILAMQERKKELVAGLLGEGAQENLQLSKDDLDHLFDPLG